MKFNKNSTYTMSGRTIVEQWGFAALAHGHLQMAAHVYKMLKNACKLLHFIRQGVEYKTKKVMVQFKIIKLSIKSTIFFSP